MPLHNREMRKPPAPPRGLVVAVVAVAALAVPHPARAQTWTLVWSDEFNGPNGAAPDPAKWRYDTGGGGFGNNELQVYCAPGSNTAPCSAANTNIFQNGAGQLVIRARNSGGTWTSGRMKTQGVAQWQYGRIEARMRLPIGAGLWPAFWMLGTDITSVGWPQCGEQDIMEWVPQYGPSTTSSALHGPGYSGGNSRGGSFTFPGGGRVDDGNYHVYGVTWSANQVQFYRDNPAQPFITLTPASIPAGAQWVYNHPFFLIMNLAIGGNFPGPPNASTPNPAQVLVDWVRVYQASGPTPPPPTPTPPPPGGSLNGTHVLTPQHATSKRMDLSGAQTFNGNKVQIWTNNGTAAQRWVFSNTGVVPAGNYNIASSLGAFCLDVAGAGTANGTKVQIWGCNGTNAQSWRAVPVSGTVYELRPANAPNSCLDVTGVSTTDGTQLQIWQCTGGANQRWSIN
jgi:beta-glucanase (GH16 family)